MQRVSIAHLVSAETKRLVEREEMEKKRSAFRGERGAGKVSRCNKNVCSGFAKLLRNYNFFKAPFFVLDNFVIVANNSLSLFLSALQTRV